MIRHRRSLTGSTSSAVFRSGTCDRSPAAVVGTPEYRDKYENKNPARGYVAAAEFDLISNRLLDTEAEKETVLPVLCAGEKKTSFPPLLHGRVPADFCEAKQYFLTAFDLVLSLYAISPQDPAVADLRELLEGSAARIG